jgi:membrane-bound ClpP family serine protease
MPDWTEILNEIRVTGSTHDSIRRKYLRELSDLTGRNTIAYYSGWLQKKGVDGVSVNDADKNGLMTVIHKLDQSKGLDLLLHTPGGEIAATESFVDYLRSIFGANIRAIVPQIAMSAGTMIACACKEIIMGKQSSLGPIDPQYHGLPAHGIVEEFDRAFTEIKEDQAKIPVWQPVLAKYHPTLIGECEKAIEWSEEMVKEWLRTGMFRDSADSKAKNCIKKIVKELGDHALSKSHARHLSLKKCEEMGLKVIPLEAEPELQDAVLSVHHACIHTFSSTGAFKIIENQKGVAFIQAQATINVQQS